METDTKGRIECKVTINAYRAVAGGKKPLRRHKHRWKDNFKINVTEIIAEDMDLIHLVQDGDRCLAFLNITSVRWNNTDRRQDTPKD
jgi:hypothetical protein